MQAEERGRVPDAPPRLPAGAPIFADEPYGLDVLARVDRLTADGLCHSGRLEVAAARHLLVCLIRDGLPLLAGDFEAGGGRTVVPLRRLHERAAELPGARCTVVRHEEALGDLLAVQLSVPPELLSSTGLVDPDRVLAGLERERADAVVALTRGASLGLLAVRGGRPEAVFLPPGEAPSAGADPGEAFLLHVFAAGAGPGRLEVHRGLSIEPDGDAGRLLTDLAEGRGAPDPPPPVDVVVRLGGDRLVSQRAFVPPQAVIGREAECDVFLDNLAVSRRHARIAWDGERFVVEDLDSANGTCLYGEPVRVAELPIGDPVEIGRFTVTLAERREVQRAKGPLLLADRPPGTAPSIEGEGQRVPLDGAVVIGKGAGVDLRARGFRVRAVHARIEDRGDGPRVSCFGGARVRVNGRPVVESPLAQGDRIEVGRSRFTVVPATGGTHPKGG